MELKQLLQSIGSNELLITIISAGIGAFIGFLSQIVIRKKDNKEQLKHHASMLYYDLKSIQEYIENERSSVNIRYYANWQETAAKCTFLTPDNTQYIYKIYDLVYNYNYSCNKIPTATIKNRFNMPEHNKLKQLIEAKKYNDIMEVIEIQGTKGRCHTNWTHTPTTLKS